MLERKRERHVSCVVKVKTENLCRTVWAKQCLYFRFKVKKWLTGLLPSSSAFFFFGKCENLGRSDDAKRRKKGGWPYKTKTTPNNQLITKNATLPYTLLSCRTRRVFLTRHWELKKWAAIRYSRKNGVFRNWRANKHLTSISWWLC